MGSSLLGRDELFHNIAEKNHADFIIVLDSREREDGTQFGGNVFLQLRHGPEFSRAADIHEEHDGELTFLFKDLNKRMIEAGRDIPIDFADIIAELVLAN